MTKVYFVRHAQPVHSDPDDRNRPLTPEGRQDAALVLETLRDRGIECFYCSPYRRSLDTIRSAADFYGPPIHTDERLREWDYGSYEDQPRDRTPDFQAAKREFGVRMKDGGESLLQLAHRVYCCIDDIRKRYAGMTVLCVCHGGVCRVAETYFRDMSTDAFSHFFMGNCELREYEI